MSMRFPVRLIALVGLALMPACQPAEQKAAPAAPALGAQAAPADSEPNANAARYGSHGVAVTPSPGSSIPPSKPAAQPEIKPGEQAPMAGAAAAGSDTDEAAGEMRGHPCHCGKTCHCGHCSGAVPGCHCHVKRADGKDSE